jgi:5-methylcytosine-specific restriction enzyme A
MTTEQFYIYKKEVDWSVLHEGFSIPVSTQINFQTHIKRFLKRGESKIIKLVLGNNTYKVKIINQRFDEKKYPTHKDIIQIRYSPRGELSKTLRTMFYSSYRYLQVRRKEVQERLVSRQVKVPDEIKEYVALYATDAEDKLCMECITCSDFSEMRSYLFSQKIKEEDFELALNYKKIDLSARIEQRSRLVKIRKLDKAIGENLKLLYNFNCQICGENFGGRYGTFIAESHHIKPFVSSMNNNADNILIICPNHHRTIHKVNPVFDFSRFRFVYPNGFEESLRLNKHFEKQCS